jgi:hypothetical protein
MGSITSRGGSWPPRPYKRPVVRNYVEVDENNIRICGGEVYTVTDYVWVYPGAKISNHCGRRVGLYADDPSPSQETAIRYLEDG